MKNDSRLIISLTVFFVAMFFTNRAHAYIDPGTGSMVVQAVIAAIAIASVSIGIFWRRLRSFFSRLFGSKKD